MEYRTSNRFDAAVLAAVTLLTLGTILGESALFVAAAVPVVYLVVDSLTRAPSPSSLVVERSFDRDVPAPGETATVTLTVRNEGNRTLPDVRVVDRLPAHIPVVEGSPRGCLSLRPGESDTVTYAVVASQGDYEFDPPLVRLRPLPAVGSITGEPTVDGNSVLRCRRGVSDVPQTSGSLQRVGTQPTDSGGPGLEFHSVREYRTGDDIGRIDWRGLAKTGELSTVNFQETRATKTVIIADGRHEARRSRDHGHPTGAELSAYAADRVFGRLLAAGNHVGLTALGIITTDIETTLPSDRTGRPWVPVGNDAATRTRVGAVLDAVVAAGQAERERPAQPSRATPDGGSRRDALAIRERLPGTADVVVTTPLLDDEPVGVATELAAAGHDVLVVTPDVTGGETPGARAAGIERRIRIERLRESSAVVVDWDTDRPLTAALEEST